MDKYIRFRCDEEIWERLLKYAKRKGLPNGANGAARTIIHDFFDQEDQKAALLISTDQWHTEMKRLHQRVRRLEQHKTEKQ